MSEQSRHHAWRRQGDPANDRIAAFLVMDIQHSPASAQDLAAKIAAVKSSELPSWERLGNAYRLYLSAEGAQIEDLVDGANSPVTVSLDELAAAVASWIDILG